MPGLLLLATITPSPRLTSLNRGGLALPVNHPSLPVIGIVILLELKKFPLLFPVPEMVPAKTSSLSITYLSAAAFTRFIAQGYVWLGSAE
jgi:hypothetical protein